MTELLARNEGRLLRPFLGSQEAEDSASEELVLKVETAQKTYELRNRDRLSIGSAEMPLAGISLRVGGLDLLLKAVAPMVLDLKDVDLLVVAIDGPKSPLQSAEVLYQGVLADTPESLTLNVRGTVSSSKILSNPHGPYSIEAALVHNKDIPTSSAIRPRRLGALLAKITFVIGPTSVDDQPKPKPMDSEKKKELGLPPHAWIYVKCSDSLLEASKFEDAFEFFVDKELFDLLMVSNPAAKTGLEALLMTTLIQSICFEASKRLLDMDEESLKLLSDSAVMALLRRRLSGQKDSEIVSDLIDSSSKVASRVLAAPSLLKGLISNLEATDAE
jgi:hypothetical protein